MMINTSTAWLPVLNICTYNGELSWLVEDLREDVNVSELDPFIIERAKESIEDLFNNYMEMNIKVSNLEIDRPMFYNYGGDVLLFTMEFDDGEYSDFMDSCNLCSTEMYNFFEKEYGSHSGFFSFMPYTEEKFCDAFANPRDDNDLAKAISMFMWYKIKTTLTEKELDYIQKSFVEDVEEDVRCNTDLCIDYYEDEENEDEE